MRAFGRTLAHESCPFLTSTRTQSPQGTHPRRNVVAALPDLGIEVIADDFDELKKRLPIEIRSALSRAQSAASLQKLIAVQRVGKLTCERHAVPVTTRSAKRRALHAQK